MCSGRHAWGAWGVRQGAWRNSLPLWGFPDSSYRRRFASPLKLPSSLITLVILPGQPSAVGSCSGDVLCSQQGSSPRGGSFYGLFLELGNNDPWGDTECWCYFLDQQGVLCAIRFKLRLQGSKVEESGSKILTSLNQRVDFAPINALNWLLLF